MQRLSYSSPPSHFVGVDAGATHVRAQAFAFSGGRLQSAGPVHKAAFPTFQAVPVVDRTGRDLEDSRWLDTVEGRAGVVRTALAAELIGQSAHGLPRVAVAVAWPGLKCDQGDSIVYAVNGPRILRLRQGLEQALLQAGLSLVAPLPPLQSDGDMAGWGEEAAPEGAFAGVASAYLLVAGTGLAEAFKVEGRMVSRRHFLEMAAPYAMHPTGLEGDFEKYLAASAWGQGGFGGLERQDRLALLRDFLTLRREQTGCDGIVLGGRFKEILLPEEIAQLREAGLSLRLSAVSDPAMWGCAAFCAHCAQSS